MHYELITSEHLDRIFTKLSKKDKLQFEIITRKIKEILENPQIGEPLKGNMADREVFMSGTFALFMKFLKMKGL